MVRPQLLQKNGFQLFVTVGGEYALAGQRAHLAAQAYGNADAHVAIGRAPHKNQPVGILVYGKIKIGPAKTHNPIIPAGSLGGCRTKLYEEMLEHIKTGSKEQLFLVTVMVGQQAEGNAGSVRNFFKRGFNIPAFAKKIFGRLKQRFFFIFVHHGFVLG